eukprot:gene3230-2212_t
MCELLALFCGFLTLVVACLDLWFGYRLVIICVKFDTWFSFRCNVGISSGFIVGGGTLHIAFVYTCLGGVVRSDSFEYWYMMLLIDLVYGTHCMLGNLVITGFSVTGELYGVWVPNFWVWDLRFRKHPNMFVVHVIVGGSCTSKAGLLDYGLAALMSLQSKVLWGIVFMLLLCFHMFVRNMGYAIAYWWEFWNELIVVYR